MSTRYTIPVISISNSASSSSSVPFSSDSPDEEGHTAESTSLQNRSARAFPASLILRIAMRISRARWFTFLRRVFHYQNGSRSDLGSNPFNSSSWMILELIALVVQLSIITVTLSVSQSEKPVWPVRIWIYGYDIGCLLSLLLLYGRYLEIYAAHGDGFSLPDLEQQRTSEESRYSHLMNRCRTSLELFYAIWFVMGNVWMFDSRFDSFNRAPKLHVLYISLVSWNALCYSFPFLLFLLLGFCVPLVSTLLGYNMNMASVEKGATEHQISNLPSWKYNALHTSLENGNSTEDCSNDLECCICLAKYKDKEEVRELPCSHMFHLNCVDQWLRIISCCPLCKQELER